MAGSQWARRSEELLAPRLSRLQSLYAYIALELAVVVAAVALPFEARALTPLLRIGLREWRRRGLAFPAIRLLSCLIMVFAPAAALGATFPMAIRWFASDSDDPARRTGVLYAVNTTGAAIGALAAGFVLIPWIRRERHDQRRHRRKRTGRAQRACD